MKTETLITLGLLAVIGWAMYGGKKTSAGTASNPGADGAPATPDNAAQRSGISVLDDVEHWLHG